MTDTGSSLEGTQFPDTTLFEGNPDTKVKTSELTAGKKVVIVGVPGAFTPTCHNSHLPGFLDGADKLKEKGVAETICVAVNDPFVMTAWGKSLNTDGRVRFLADTHGELAKALGIELDASAVLGNVRCKRFAAIVDDGKITKFLLEPTGGGLEESTAENVLAAL